MYKEHTIGVVIPAYNEAKQIGRVIETMPDFVDKIIIVDDKSKDETVFVVKDYQKENAAIVLIENATNSGCGGSLANGYNWVKDNPVDIVVRMDGDGQMNPDDIVKLLDPIVDNMADYTKGNRLFTGEAFSKIPKIRYFGNSVLSLLTKIASGYWDIADSQSGFCAIHYRALKMIDWNKMYKRYGNPNDVLVRLNVFDFRVKDVAVAPIYNVGEKSNMKIYVVIFTIGWMLFKLFLWRLKEKYIVRDFHPLVFFYIMGMGLLALSLWFFSSLIAGRIENGFFPPITTLSWLFSISMGFQSLFFAMWFDKDYRGPNH